MHICPNCMMVVLMAVDNIQQGAIPAIKRFLHWLYHRVWRSHCNSPEECHAHEERQPLDILDPG